MTETTKMKLMHVADISKEEADLLESAGILYPTDVRKATDKRLKEIGLSGASVKELRKKLPKME